MIKNLKKHKSIRLIITAICVVVSAYFQAFVINVFIQPADLLSSGFTGVAILIDKIASLYGGSISVSLAMIALNVPVAILCYRNISPKFTFFSILQVFLASFFLNIIHFPPLFDDILLNVVFGGFCYGIAVVIALKGNASTGGTDFLALYVSNKTGRSIWSYVFVFNTIILCIFGYMFGWEHAGYSILFQFISTKTIDSFHHRYERVTLQITTVKGDEVIEAYIKEFRHGVSKLFAVGGYSKKEFELIHTVVSSYEVQDIVDVVRQVDSKAIINVLKTENFFGGFYQAPLD